MHDSYWRARCACAILAALLLAACGRADGPAAQAGPTPPPASPSAPPAASLDGTSWQLAAFESGGAGKPPMSGSRITAQFEQGKISGSSGCNTYGGAYTLSGSAISFKDIAQTMMACADEGLMQQEQVFGAALLSAKTYKLAGDALAIAYDGGTLRFVRQQPAADRPLEGTTWRLTTFVAGDVASSLIADTEITAELKDGKVAGSAGCNRYFGGYTLNGPAIAFGELGSTKMACPAETMAQEQQYLTALRAATAFAVAGDQLTIEHSGGKLVFSVKQGA